LKFTETHVDGVYSSMVYDLYGGVLTWSHCIY